MMLVLQLLLSCISGAQNNLPIWPDDFKWSSAGIPNDYNCIQINEGAEPHETSWHDNYFCWRNFKRNPGFKWSSAGSIPNMRCIQIQEGADPHTWNDNYLCERNDSPYKFTWSSAGVPWGRSCIQWVEASDPATWHDNYLCGNKPNSNLPNPVFPTDFKWSSSGVPSGYDCERILENSDPHTWHDNYFCWKTGKKYLGIRWSMAGTVNGKRCTRISEPQESHYWSDNYLCINHNTIQFYWSSNGQLPGKTCMKWYENSDPNSWNDNFLCANQASNLRNPVFPNDFKWSSGGVPVGYDCERIAEVDPHSWHDNYFCWKQETKNPGIKWSSAGPIGGMRCTLVSEPFDPHTWNDNYLCVPNSSNLKFKWSFQGSNGCSKCIRWLESSDPHSWSDNYLCDDSCNSKDLPNPVFPNDFKWSSTGVPLGYHCERIVEGSDPHSWHDNYFCWNVDTKDPGIKWSSAGPIGGMRCTQILEPSDPYTWNDNYLCVPQSSSLRFKWSYRGSYQCNKCIQWLESSDPHTWSDNYLCDDSCDLYDSEFDKPYNEYTWVTTHNAHADAGKVSAYHVNQWTDMYDQMKHHNVRGLMIDIRWDGEHVELTHAGDNAGIFWERMQGEVVRFLNEDPLAVLWFDIEVSGGSEKLSSDQFESAMDRIPDITNKMFNPKLWPEHKEWPTLGELISCGQRIIMVIDQDTIAGEYEKFTILYRKDVTAENYWAVTDKNSCDERHGYNDLTINISGKNWSRLFTMNHFGSWNYNPLGNMDKAVLAAKENSWDGLFERVLFCTKKAGIGSYPNFLAVDWVTEGDVQEIAEVLTEGGFIFYEGNGATQNIVCGIGAGFSRSVKGGEKGCENDEARSVRMFNVPANTRLQVFDSPDGSMSDDFNILRTTRKIEDESIHSFEQDLNTNSFSSIFLRNNGLDGKVSLFKVTANVGLGDTTPLIVFYEGNGASQNIVCTLSQSHGESLNFKNSGECDNDEARSVKLIEVPADSEIKVYDNPNGSTGDDYTVIKVLSDIVGGYIVHSFERSYSDSFVTVQFHNHNGLDGKVSRAVYSFGAH